MDGRACQNDSVGSFEALAGQRFLGIGPSYFVPLVQDYIIPFNVDEKILIDPNSFVGRDDNPVCRNHLVEKIVGRSGVGAGRVKYRDSEAGPPFVEFPDPLLHNRRRADDDDGPAKSRVMKRCD